jgi:hypothetical protein
LSNFPEIAASDDKTSVCGRRKRAGFPFRVYPDPVSPEYTALVDLAPPIAPLALAAPMPPRLTVGACGIKPLTVDKPPYCGAAYEAEGLKSPVPNSSFANGTGGKSRPFLFDMMDMNLYLNNPIYLCYPSLGMNFMNL